jgi:pimeloyl-ACP methyl ester carboxylesterase
MSSVFGSVDAFTAGGLKGAELREFDVEADDGRILHAYDVGPTGRSDELALLWHHGTPNIGAPPEPLFGAAKRLGIRWFGYDRPGYGGSAPHPGAPVATAAIDAARLADHLGIGRFAVFGHSGGGPRAMACGVLLADRILSVVVVSSPAPWPAEGLDFFAGMSDGSVRELAAAADGRSALEQILASTDFDPQSFTAADWSALNGEWSWFDDIVTAATAHGFGGMIEDDLAAMSPWGFDVGQLSKPTLIMHGTDDRMIPSSHAEWLAARCPQAELQLEAGQGHISVLGSAPSALEWIRDGAVG